MNIQSVTGAVAGNLLQRPTATSEPGNPPAVSKTPAPQQPSAAASREQVEEAIKAVNEFVNPINSAIQFNLDDQSGRMIVKVVDNTTNEVIRQFPSEEMLNIARALDRIKGLLVQQKA
jgi:flagellar protein FlaG